MPAVLDRPDALAAELACLRQQIIERAPLRADRPVGDHAAGRRVDRADRMRCLCVSAPITIISHRSLLEIGINEQITGRHISVGAMPRSYQVTPAILERRRATQPPTVRPKADTRLTDQPAAEPRTYRSCRTPPPDSRTLSLRSRLS